ncbi:MAG: glycosyltransferase family 2 protein [Actinomycetes bacterium]
MTGFSSADVSAVVCTMNSISGVESCLTSLRAAGVGQLVVVDANSHDGTRQVAERLADVVLSDPGIGLGMARNVGIAVSTEPLILNMGSDNVMPPGQLQRMIDYKSRGKFDGVSAQTLIVGGDYLSQSLNSWRKGRFRPGRAAVIGTPTLFSGDLLRQHPYDPTRRFSDDSELCERWERDLDATFAISDAYVEEIGKTSWNELVVRCRMYGISDKEVFTQGRSSGWSVQRQLKSLAHPMRADFIDPITHLSPLEAAKSAPFLVAFAGMRYAFWIAKVLGSR